MSVKYQHEPVGESLDWLNARGDAMVGLYACTLQSNGEATVTVGNSWPISDEQARRIQLAMREIIEVMREQALAHG